MSDPAVTWGYAERNAQQTVSRSPGRVPTARQASSKGGLERLAQSQEKRSSLRTRIWSPGRSTSCATKNFDMISAEPGRRSAPRRPASLLPDAAVEAGAGHARCRLPERCRLPVASLFGAARAPCVRGRQPGVRKPAERLRQPLIGRGRACGFTRRARQRASSC